VTINAAGQVVTGAPPRMSPIYQELKLPGQSGISFNLMEAFVPRTSGENQVQSLTAFMAANADPGADYGRLTVYETPVGQTVDGPSIIDAQIQADGSLAKAITQLNQQGSSVVLSNLFMVPIGQSILYFRALYVQSARFPVPVLYDVIAVYGGGGNSGSSQVAVGNSVASALSGLNLNGYTPPSGTQPNQGTQPTSPGTLSAQEKMLNAEIATIVSDMKADLKNENLGKFQSDFDQLVKVTQELDNLTAKSNSSTTSTSTSTTTTQPGTSSTTASTTSTSTPSTSGSGTTTTDGST
jgi:hypothetical protein